MIGSGGTIGVAAVALATGPCHSAAVGGPKTRHLPPAPLACRLECSGGRWEAAIGRSIVPVGGGISLELVVLSSRVSVYTVERRGEGPLTRGAPDPGRYQFHFQ